MYKHDYSSFEAIDQVKLNFPPLKLTRELLFNLD